MSNKIEAKEVPSKSGPEPEVVERTEFTIRVSCEKTKNGIRSCKIQDVIFDDLHAGQPVQVSPQITQDPVVTPAPALPDPTANTSKDCGLCDIVADMISQKKDVKSLPKDDVPQPTAQGRRFENRPTRDASASRQWRMSDRRRDRVAE